MKQVITFLCISFLVTSLAAQNPNDAIVVFSGGTMRTMNIQDKKSETEGSHYYNNDWYPGTVTLFSGEEIKDYPLKYDMKMNQVDIKVDELVKFISVGAVKEIKWKQSDGQVEILQNVSLYSDYKGIGFFSVLAQGTIMLFKKTELTLLEANYNAAMDVGSENKKYVKKDKYYILKDGKVNEIKKSKKKVTEILSDQSTKVEEFVDQNKLNVKDEQDLIRIFDYYNSL
jgi:hypothetical protein